jgi:uncharacterized protein Yka (UPF0111/DUF47 family)
MMCICQLLKKNQQSFELFANWAKTLLQDFNEIDRYLLDSSYVLSYLKDIEDIKKWGNRIKHNYLKIMLKLLPLPTIMGTYSKKELVIKD